MDRIQVTTGTGSGATKASALDSALFDCGFHNRNIQKLSSVIPPETEVDIVDEVNDSGGVGDVSRCVLSTAVSQPNSTDEVKAGLGWQVYDFGGFFVEVADEENNLTVSESLDASMREFRTRRSIDQDPSTDSQQVAAITGTLGKYQVALVLAHYTTMPVSTYSH